MFRYAVSDASPVNMGSLPSSAPSFFAVSCTPAVSGPVTFSVNTSAEACPSRRSAASLASPCQMQLKLGVVMLMGFPSRMLWAISYSTPYRRSTA